MKSFDDYKILQDYLEQENFINSVPNCFIPINEGDENLVFCYLTYNIYTAFFIKKSKPQNTNNLINYFNEKTNNFNEIKIVNTKGKFIKKKMMVLIIKVLKLKI